MSQKLFRLVDIVDALASASCVLRVDRSNGVPSRADAQDQPILGTNGFFVFSVSLNNEMQDGLLVLVLHQTMNDKWQADSLVHESLFDAPDAQQDTHAFGHAVNLGITNSDTSTALVVVESEDATVLDRQILIRVPGRGSE